MSDDVRLVETDQPGLMRDENSRAIISTDNKKLSAHRAREKQFRSTQLKINSIDGVIKEK